MAAHLVVQASGAMFSTLEPAGWVYMFGLFVTDQDGTPVQGLKKKNFTVWELTTIGDKSVALMTELNADFPTSKMPGVYRIQTTQVLGPQAPAPQEFVFALRVAYKKDKVDLQGMTTVPITYLGKMH
jgi:hypothetical protein